MKFSFLAMKKVFLLLLPLLVASPVVAREIRSTIVDSVQLTVDGPALTTTRQGGTYSVSGNNVSVGSNGLGGWNGDTTSSGAPDFSAGSYTVNTAGQSFSFTESISLPDAPIADQTALTSGGRVDEPVLYGSSTQYQGGTAGDLAGTLSPTGIATVTAGGAGTTAIGQRSVELSVFE